MKVIPYSPEFEQKLRDFLDKTYPHRNPKYFDYRFFDSLEEKTDVKNNFIALDDEENIVGCYLALLSKALIFNKEESVVWGVDLFVEEGYHLGIDLLLHWMKLKNAFAHGLTPKAFQIYKRLKISFIVETKAWVAVNITLIPNVFSKVFTKKTRSKEFSAPPFVRFGNYSFERVKKVEELCIPNSGYWCAGTLDIEFVRDAHFLKHRFFENFNTYFVYKINNPEGYFVIRQIEKMGFSALSIVDFRFPIDQPSTFRAILKAAHKIAVRNRIPLLFCRTSFPYQKISLFPLTWRQEKIGHVILNNKKIIRPHTLITDADSDSDFIKSTPS